MNDIHRAVLREKNDFLIKEITSTHILQKLLLARVIDRDQAAKVLDSHEKSKNEGTELLLQHVSRGSSKSFDIFVEVLRRENYDNVANELVKAVTKKEKLQHSKIPVTPKSNRKAINHQTGNMTYRSDEKTPASNKSTNATKANDLKSDKSGTKDKTFVAKPEGRHISRQPQAQTTTDKPSHGSKHGVRSSINDSKSNAARHSDTTGKTNPTSSVSPKKTQSSNTTTSVSTKSSKNATNTTNSNSTRTSKSSNAIGNSKQANARSSQATSKTNPQTSTRNTQPSNAKPSNGTSPSKSSHSTSSSKQSNSTSSSKPSHSTSPSKQPNAASNSNHLMISSTKLPTKTKQPNTKGPDSTSTGTNNKSQSMKRDNGPPVANSKPLLTASSKPLNSKTAGTGNAKQSKPESNDEQQLHQQKAATGRTPKPAGVQPKTKPSKRFMN